MAKPGAKSMSLIIQPIRTRFNGAAKSFSAEARSVSEWPSTRSRVRSSCSHRLPELL